MPTSSYSSCICCPSSSSSSGSTSSGSSNIATGCCPNMPSVLNAHVTASCSCLNGDYTLVWNGSGSWSSGGNTRCGVLSGFNITLSCITGSSCLDFRCTSGCPGFGAFVAPTSCVCSPFEAIFTIPLPDIDGCCPSGTITIDITG